MTTREIFLQRVRQAVNEGNRAAPVAHLPQRGPVGYQGAGTDPIQRFATELTAAGGQAHVVSRPEQAVAKVLEIIQTKNARKIFLGSEDILHQLGLGAMLHERGLEVITVAGQTAAGCREPFFQADLGISGVAHLVAETGTVVMASAPAQPRSLSLLPPVHIALARPSQILSDLFDLFDLFSPVGAPGKSSLPSCLSLITGPSKTGDIEMKLVTGVHGPGELHVILGTW